jgi:hypothetical protein
MREMLQPMSWKPAQLAAINRAYAPTFCGMIRAAKSVVESFGELLGSRISATRSVCRGSFSLKTPWFGAENRPESKKIVEKKLWG